MKEKLKIGIMGFGKIGRQLYELSLTHDDLTIVAVADLATPEILHHLTSKALAGRHRVTLEGSYLVCGDQRTRFLNADRPDEVPWDLLSVDTVIDATGRFRDPATLRPHLGNGAQRVITTTPASEPLDRCILFGVNEAQLTASDQLISAGSSSTTAAALLLKSLASGFRLKHASMTSVHAYTSDQNLQDTAGPDYRRSRSGAVNIIPNMTPALTLIPEILAFLTDKFTAYAMNVPVQTGSMLDLTLVLERSDVTVREINEHLIACSEAEPQLMSYTRDPIVSSDIKGCRTSVHLDTEATLKAGQRTFKIIAWHESMGHAARILDLAVYARKLQDHQLTGAAA